MTRFGESRRRALVSRYNHRVPPESVIEFLRTWGYPAYFLMFIVAALGSPVTEDALLLASGYLIGIDVFAWWPTAPIAFVGVLTTDVIFLFYGRKLRAHTLRGGWIRRIIRPGRLRIATRWFARLGDWVVFLARLTPGTRMIVFVSAGVRGMAVSRFLLLDALASLLYVPLLIVGGESLGERAGSLGKTLEWVADRVLYVGVAVAVVFLARRIFLRRERKRFPAVQDDPNL